jgi:hypothetical protein
MLTPDELRSHARRWIAEAKALSPGDPEFARLVKLAKDTLDIAYSWEIQDEMIAQAEHGAPDEADVEGF